MTRKALGFVRSGGIKVIRAGARAYGDHYETCGQHQTRKDDPQLHKTIRRYLHLLIPPSLKELNATQLFKGNDRAAAGFRGNRADTPAVCVLLLMETGNSPTGMARAACAGC